MKADEMLLLTNTDVRMALNCDCDMLRLDALDANRVLGDTLKLKNLVEATDPKGRDIPLKDNIEPMLIFDDSVDGIERLAAEMLDACDVVLIEPFDADCNDDAVTLNMLTCVDWE